MQPFEIALIAAAFAAGSFIFGASGFGFGLVTVPLLGIVLPIKDAIALQLPYAYLVAFAAAWHYREHLAWRAMWPLLAASLVTLPLGVAALEYVPERPMKYLLALFIIAAIAFSGRRIFRKANAYAYGTVSGFFQGAFTTGGPPAMLYLLATSTDPRTVKGTNGLFFIFLYGATTVLYVFAGTVTSGHILQAAWFAPAVVVGGLAGYWAGVRLNFQQYRNLVNGLLVATAVMLVVRA